MARVTAMNNSEFSSGTLIRAYDGIARYETDDIEELDGLLTVQSAVSTTLESRGFEFDEDENEWFCPVNEMAGVIR